MKSFGRLLKKMRGTTPLEEIAERTRMDAEYLARIEGGREVPPEVVARHLLTRGFGLDRGEVSRVVLGIQLYDLGLRDNELRQLVIDLIQKTAPARVREEVLRLYRSYAG